MRMARRRKGKGGQTGTCSATGSSYTLKRKRRIVRAFEDRTKVHPGRGPGAIGRGPRGNVTRSDGKERLGTNWLDPYLSRYDGSRKTDMGTNDPEG